MVLDTAIRQRLAYCGAPEHATAVLECPQCMSRLQLVDEVATLVRASTLNEALTARVDSMKQALTKAVTPVSAPSVPL